MNNALTLARPMRILQHLTRRLNRTLNDREFKDRRVKLRSYPYIIHIDPTNHCNLRCPLCPTGQGIMPSQGMMSFETFKGIFDQFRMVAYTVQLYNWGEPLLNPEIFRMLRYISRYNIQSLISTNFNIKMTPEVATEMVESGLKTLNVSFDGLTQETYEKYRIRGKVDRVIENIKLLVETKKRLGVRYPQILMQFIPFKHNEHEVVAAAEFAKQIGVDRFHVQPAIPDMSTVATQKIAKSVEANQNWLALEEQNKRHNGGKWIYDPEACHYLWNSAVFRWDGAVYPCCIVYRDEDAFGNIKKLPFSEIWNGPQYRSARALFGNKTPSDKVFTTCDVCFENEGYKVVNK